MKINGLEWALPLYCGLGESREERMPSHRIHGMDHLRAHMMLLGIVFHICLSYGNKIEQWAYQADTHHVFFSAIAGTIHVFRMPVFFLVAGFFAALILCRKGRISMLRNRTQRIAIPLLLFWAPLYYFTHLSVDYSHWQLDNSQQPWHLPSMKEAFSNASLIHLWFLYYLFGFSLLAVVIDALFNSHKLKYLSNHFYNRYSPALLGLLIVPYFWCYQRYDVPAPMSFIPSPFFALYYGGFFIAGMLLHYGEHTLQYLEAHCFRWLKWFLWCTLLHWATGYIVLSEEAANHHGHRWYSALFLAMAIAALALFITSAYLRWVNFHSKAALFISESSYWLYLIHLPLVIWIPALLHESSLSALQRVFISFVATFAIGMLSYILLVRYTPLGKLLNGKRYRLSFSINKPIAQAES